MKTSNAYDGNQVVSWDKCDWQPKKESEPQKVGTLKLSEAIRIGAAMRPQGKGKLFEGGKSCAWGAAYEGSGGKYDETLLYSEIAYQVSRRLRAGDAYGNGEYSIACMNDNGMSREAIADFLESKGY